ncbi:hypothetical protein QBC38DRAFT_147546 [Podospora fimiseda]|uniref:LDB19 N-terminal domain-containing protein n=1 Tax=Podospora fimiseda TaxID=252190 RepID=A0AAN7H5U6_9PEZI|nr:hypothetical protein QBC38DRAFT_147546 [Podospora fimiseda]
MPHRVVDFFRSSTHTIENQVAGLTKKAHQSSRRRDSPTGRGSSRGRSELLTSYASSEEEVHEERDSHAPLYSPRLKMGDSRTSSISSESHSHKEKEHGHHHRLSFPGIHFGRSNKETHSVAPATIDWQLESPPIILHGTTETSTGALVSGQLFLNIKEESLEVELFVATLNIRTTQKKPFKDHCNECASQITEIQKWTLLDHPLVLAKGQHSFPFSVLLGGHLPASMDTPLAAITYEFKAKAIPKTAVPISPVKLEKTLDVKRALPVSEHPHHSVRVFPPTNIKASAHYPHVIHPIGRYNLSLRLDGIAKLNTRVNTIEYWKLKKLTWRLEETIKTVAPACGRHSPKVGEVEDSSQKKGIIRAETRVIGEKTLFSGWKSNYTSATDSSVELELEYDVAKSARSTCDAKTLDGTEVTHQLMIEMVVSQEWAPVNKPALVTHTGVGRILRMHFGTILTERGGIGISWDRESPPIYQDVPPSPPAYSHEMFLHGDATIAEVIEPLDGSGFGDEPPPLFEDVVHQSGHRRVSSDGR